MNLFVTGATGFIGGHFLREALSAGHHVFALRRTGSKPRIALPREPTWLEGQLSDDWSDTLAQCDALVHLAAAGVNPLHSDWDELFQVNVCQSLSLWRRAAAAGVKRFVIIGSCFEYGKSGERVEFITTETPLEPTTAYAASKAAATMAALAFAVEANIELIVLRPFHVFGDGEEATRLWPALRKAAREGNDFNMTMGEQIRDFMPVENAAQIILNNSLRNDIHPGRPIIQNVGSGIPQTLRAFAEFWWQHWNAPGDLKIGAFPYRSNEVMRYVAKLQ
jgi:nucleoside-diphosphate-sugar epimerase